MTEEVIAERSKVQNERLRKLSALTDAISDQTRSKGQVLQAEEVRRNPYKIIVKGKKGHDDGC